MLTPLAFQPIFKTMLWGGRRLPAFLNVSGPTEEPIGEAWVLSDVDGSLSRLADGRTLREVIQQNPAAIFGENIPSDNKFPLLLKFIDAQQELSVQVHPNDAQAESLYGVGQRGKTEAWVIQEADPNTSKIYAGFKPGVDDAKFREAMANKSTPGTLHSFTPKPGDCVFLNAGTVHAIGANILLFEVQQTSDITYRLYDWDRVDAKTGQPRQLHIQNGLACSNFANGPCEPVQPVRQGRWESLVDCPYFTLNRCMTDSPLSVGNAGQCRVIVTLSGQGELRWQNWAGRIQPGQVYLLPASVGECEILPRGMVTILECGLPQGK
jgi:mannose-6-phosphate isomerase